MIAFSWLRFMSYRKCIACWNKEQRQRQREYIAKYFTSPQRSVRWKYGKI